MTFPEFQFQIERLTSTWPHSYPEERIKMIFQEISDLPISWMIKMCDQFIGACRHAPLVPEFRDAANLYRKNKNTQPPAQGGANFASDDESIFSEADTRMMFEMIRRKMYGGVSDSEWESFKDYVESMLRAKEQMKRALA